MLLASAASAAAILGGLQIGNVATTSLTATTDASGPDTATGSTGSSGSSSASAGSAASDTAAGATDGTWTGTAVGTRFGDVQVRVTISNGTISDVTALQLTDSDGRSIQISNRAAPLLRDEVLRAQTANVSMIGGATYTSQAYLRSLQSALDQAGF